MRGLLYPLFFRNRRTSSHVYRKRGCISETVQVFARQESLLVQTTNSTLPVAY